MATKKRLTCNHDFIVPKGETLLTEARCATCGAEPPTERESFPVREVEPDEWYDTMIAVYNK